MPPLSRYPLYPSHAVRPSITHQIQIHDGVPGPFSRQWDILKEIEQHKGHVFEQILRIKEITIPPLLNPKKNPLLPNEMKSLIDSFAFNHQDCFRFKSLCVLPEDSPNFVFQAFLQGVATFLHQDKKLKENFRLKIFECQNSLVFKENSVEIERLIIKLKDVFLDSIKKNQSDCKEILIFKNFHLFFKGDVLIKRISQFLQPYFEKYYSLYFLWITSNNHLSTFPSQWKVFFKFIHFKFDTLSQKIHFLHYYVRKELILPLEKKKFLSLIVKAAKDLFSEENFLQKEIFLIQKIELALQTLHPSSSSSLVEKLIYQECFKQLDIHITNEAFDLLQQGLSSLFPSIPSPEKEFLYLKTLRDHSPEGVLLLNRNDILKCLISLLGLEIEEGSLEILKNCVPLIEQSSEWSILLLLKHLHPATASVIGHKITPRYLIYFLIQRGNNNIVLEDLETLDLIIKKVREEFPSSPSPQRELLLIEELKIIYQKKGFSLPLKLNLSALKFLFEELFATT